MQGKDNVNKGVYREEDDRIGWRVAGSNECEIDFWETWRIWRTVSEAYRRQMLLGKQCLYYQAVI